MILRKAAAILALFLASGLGVHAGETVGRADKIKPGEWAVYRMGSDKVIERQTVISIEGEGDEAEMTFEALSINNGKREVNEGSIPLYVLRQQAANSAANTVRKEKITVKGVEFTASVVVEKQEGEELTIYESSDAPVFGVIKVMRKGSRTPVAELIDFGYAE